jgi:hypothetical protein
MVTQFSTVVESGHCTPSFLIALHRDTGNRGGSLCQDLTGTFAVPPA